jgi:SPP1 gp7 family putative phage head morphogenesis protein
MWGAHKADGRIAAKNSVKVRAALRLSIDAKQIYEDYQHTHPFVTDNITQDRARARAWAMLHVQVNEEPMTAVLRKVYADGYVLGEASAKESIAKVRKAQKKTADDTSATVDWSTWTPGNKAAALLLKPRGAFKAFLDNAGIVSKAIKKAGYDRIGTALADSIAAGYSPAKAAKVINEKIGDPARALTIAITEQNRAMSAASLFMYEEAEIEQVEWNAVEPCDICAPNDGQVVTLGQAFESGDTQPPAHPNCRCALLPVIIGMVDDPSLGQDYLNSLAYD